MREDVFHSYLVASERVEQLRERQGLKQYAYWYLPGYRLLPVVVLCLAWATADALLLPVSEGAAGLAKLGVYLLAPLLGYLIHDRIYEPAFGRPWDPKTGFREGARSAPGLALAAAVCVLLPSAAYWWDLTRAWPISCTLVSLGLVSLWWWKRSGTKGGLFLVEDHWRLATAGLPFRSAVWEWCGRHYCLILAGFLFAAGLAPLMGLVEAELFQSVVLLEVIVALGFAVCAFFDHRRVKRVFGRVGHEG